MKIKTLFIFALLSLTALLLAACGGSEQPQGAQNDFTVKVKDDFKFDPETLTVKAGEEINVTFENTSALAHSFAILRPGVDPVAASNASEDELHDDLVLEIHEISGGQSASESFTAPSEAGEYVIACLVPGHAAAGMVGTLVVEP